MSKADVVFSQPATVGNTVKRNAWVFALLATASACAQDVIVRDLPSEKEANEIVEVLAYDGITATKAVIDDGRTKVYQILVPGSRRLDAIAILNQHDLPKEHDPGYNVYGEGGLIPSASQEKAKFLQAVEGEIENMLRLVNGVLDASVQVVMPEDSVLRASGEAPPPTTASVVLVYLPGANDAKPISVPEVKSLVARGAEKLTDENITVVMSRKELSPLFRRILENSTSGSMAGCKGLQCMSNKQLNTGVAGFAALILILGAFIIFTQTRLRSVRGRLIRLQSEIAKARRRPPGEGGASGAA